MHVHVTCKYKKDQLKKMRKGGDIVFPIISQWGLSVAMETRVLIDGQTTNHWYTIRSPCGLKSFFLFVYFSDNLAEQSLP